MNDLKHVIEDLVIKIETCRIIIGGRGLETGGVFMVEMLDCPARVGWYWCGFM